MATSSQRVNRDFGNNILFHESPLFRRNGLGILDGTSIMISKALCYNYGGVIS